ncbi:MAG: hypothetical protein GPJ54_18550 [Candidatus Heimdallarchaeota archaeon]|nr:hypothetical protein [Candidatus Heimdallarchaeota archaeon]
MSEEFEVLIEKLKQSPPDLFETYNLSNQKLNVLYKHYSLSKNIEITNLKLLKPIKKLYYKILGNISIENRREKLKDSYLDLQDKYALLVHDLEYIVTETDSMKLELDSLEMAIVNTHTAIGGRNIQIDVLQKEFSKKNQRFHKDMKPAKMRKLIDNLSLISDRSTVILEGNKVGLARAGNTLLHMKNIMLQMEIDLIQARDRIFSLETLEHKIRNRFSILAAIGDPFLAKNIETDEIRIFTEVDRDSAIEFKVHREAISNLKEKVENLFLQFARDRNKIEHGIIENQFLKAELNSIKFPLINKPIQIIA